MRVEGRISQWNDERGFGYVVPVGGGPRLFVHVSAFPRGAQRPARGTLISYQPCQDAKGRPQAQKVRYTRDSARPSEAAPRLPQRGLALLVLAGIVALAALGLLPRPVASGYLFLSLVSFLAYGMDKAAANRGGWRVKENTLHLFDLLGGWPGGLLAQRQFRHKTVKRSFQRLFWASVAVNLLILGWLLRSGQFIG